MKSLLIHYTIFLIRSSNGNNQRKVIQDPVIKTSQIKKKYAKNIIAVGFQKKNNIKNSEVIE